MGIKGIYNEIGPGERIALSKLAVQTYERTGRPLRLAIDISIWLFQIQSGKGGTNPALRTFYYRLVRLISLSIHPFFVFDGPNKPPFKRGKRTGPNVASIPEFLAKQLLKQFAIPFHIAPGEAEAECALLQREGIVDAVLSEDVDTLMFGSGLTLRNWSPEGSLKTKTFTHVNLYDAQKTKAGRSGLDREGMILVALMSGGDYIPEGIPGCGPKTACDAARGGFGADLCKLSRNDLEGIAHWKERLMHELRTNERKIFRSKHKALIIPDDFPRRDVLRYYTHPCISSESKLVILRQSLKWDQDIDIAGLRTFVGEAFDWVCVSGAKKFVRNLAPALLVKELRLRANESSTVLDDTYVVAQREAQLIKTIHMTRQHVSTDNTTELRVGFIPIDLVKIDLDEEESDPEDPSDGSDSEAGDSTGEVNGDVQNEPGSPRKKRVPSTYDPTCLEKIWIFETFVKIGVPLKVQDWEESFRNPKKYQAMKAQTKRAEISNKSTTSGGMPLGAIDRFTKVTKAGVSSFGHSLKEKLREVEPLQVSQQRLPSSREMSVTPVLSKTSKSIAPARPTFRMPPTLPPSPPKILSKPRKPLVIDILSSPDTSTAKRRRTLQRSQSDTSTMSSSRSANKLSGPEMDAATFVIIDKCSLELETISELPPSVTKRRKRSPLRRTQTIATVTPFEALRPETPPASQLALFQKPSPLPFAVTSFNARQIRSVEENINLGVSQMTTGSPPSTPKRKKWAAPSRTVIMISSSPATPRPKQRSIAEYYSPLSAKPTPSKAMKDLDFDPGSIIQPPSPTTAVTSKPVFRLSLANVGTAPTNKIESCNCSHINRGHKRTEVTSVVPLEDETAEGGFRGSRNVIRLRDSLNGAWRAEQSTPKSASPGNKRRRAGRDKEWRISQVEELDLTAV